MADFAELDDILNDYDTWAEDGSLVDGEPQGVNTLRKLAPLAVLVIPWPTIWLRCFTALRPLFGHGVGQGDTRG